MCDQCSYVHFISWIQICICLCFAHDHFDTLKVTCCQVTEVFSMWSECPGFTTISTFCFLDKVFHLPPLAKLTFGLKGLRDIMCAYTCYCYVFSVLLKVCIKILLHSSEWNIVNNHYFYKPKPHPKHPCGPDGLHVQGELCKKWVM